jgi:hypothetical protein
MTENNEQPPETAAELLRRGPESARELLARKKRDRAQGDLQRPPRDDPRYTDQSVPPGTEDIPAGGTTGGGMGGGSSQRRKR